jgi:hypothetical protein
VFGVETVSSRFPGLLIWILVALCIANLVRITTTYQPDIFFQDQWDFSQPSFLEAGWLQHYTWQHGPHRQGLPFLLTQAVREWTGWDARWESLLGVAFLSGAGVLALLLIRRIRGRWSWLDLGVPLLLLAPVHLETVVLTPNLSHSVFPLFGGLLAAHALLLGRRRLGLLLCGVVASQLVFSGFGLFLAFCFGVLLGVRCIVCLFSGSRWEAVAAAAGAGCILLFGLLFIQDYRFLPAVDCFTFPHQPISDYGRFLVGLLARPLGVASDASGAALVVATLLITSAAGLWSRGRLQPGGWQVPAIIAVFLCAGILYAANIAFGRVCLGPEQAGAGRYATLIAPVWFALFLLRAAVRGATLSGLVAGIVLLLFVSTPWIRSIPRIGTSVPWLPGLRSQTALDHHQHMKLSWLAREAAGLPAEDVLLHPDPVGSGLRSRLGWLAFERVGPYRSDLSRMDWLPWSWPRETPILEGARFGARSEILVDGTFALHPVGDGGWLNLRLEALGPSDGRQGSLVLVSGPMRIPLGWATELELSIPCERGVPVRFETLGDYAPGPQFIPRWKLIRPRQEQLPRHRTLKPSVPDAPAAIIEGVSGLHGPEGGLRWCGPEVVFQLSCAEDSLLRIHVVDAHEGAGSGPLEAGIGGEVRRLAREELPAVVEIPVPAGTRSGLVRLAWKGGGIVPAEQGVSADSRSLAFRIRRIELVSR